MPKKKTATKRFKAEADKARSIRSREGRASRLASLYGTSQTERDRGSGNMNEVKEDLLDLVLNVLATKAFTKNPRWDVLIKYVYKVSTKAQAQRIRQFVRRNFGNELAKEAVHERRTVSYELSAEVKAALERSDLTLQKRAARVLGIKPTLTVAPKLKKTRRMGSAK